MCRCACPRFATLRPTISMKTTANAYGIAVSSEVAKLLGLPNVPLITWGIHRVSPMLLNE